MRLLFRIAVRALLRNRLSLILLVTAVTAGVAFQIPNSANLSGYTHELLRQALSRSTGHLEISPARPGTIDGVAPLLRKLGQLPFVRAVAPRLVHGGVLFRRGEHQPIRLVGIEPEAEELANGLCHRLDEGRCPSVGSPASAADERAVLLGGALAEKLEVKPGEKLKLVIPYEDLGEVKYSSAWYTVAGILRAGGGFSADTDVFVRLEMLRKLAGAEDRASSISLYVDNAARTAAYAQRVRPLLSSELRLQPWWQVSRFVADAIAGNRSIATISMVMVIAAVMIPVSALLYILVLHERRPIAILGALGFTRSSLFAIYLLKAVLVGLSGVALGNAGGYLICRYFQARPIFSHDGFVVRPELSLAAVAIPSLVLLIVTILSGIVPALLAARSNPATALRED